MIGNGVEAFRELLQNHELIIVSNRGPITWQECPDGELEYQRGGGGLVTALTGLAQHVEAVWVASPMSAADRAWNKGMIDLEGNNGSLTVQFIDPDPAAYEAYYNTFSNPLLWFLQHGMWDLANTPTIDRRIWQAWENGYIPINAQFAEVVAGYIRKSQKPALVMLQDYHLYAAPKMIRKLAGARRKYTLTHFVHIPWPGTEDWGILPPEMRKGILEGLLAVDLLGFQTKEDGLNFIRTCESYLDQARVYFKGGRISYKNHMTWVRDFPISIDVPAIQQFAKTEEVDQFYQLFHSRFADKKIIVRIDRTEPSKNIVRGFQAFDEMLEQHPEHKGKVVFLALMVPSRLEVEEYQTYLDGIMAAGGRVNARHGDSDWEPVRVLVGENYARAIALLQLYDVLLVNSIADGMNLVAKEGPTVNQRDGVVILSERTGARQQLEHGALVIPPCDIVTTAEALHCGLIMDKTERKQRANALKESIEREDITAWLCWQLDAIQKLGL